MSEGIVVHNSMLLRGDEEFFLCPISTGQTVVCQLGYLPSDARLAKLKDAIAETERFSEGEREQINQEWRERQREENRRRYAEFSDSAETGGSRPNSRIYIMLNERNGMVKIGMSKSPRTRERTLQSQEPEVKMIYCSERFYSWTDEQSIHAKFSAKRVRGEWFSLNEEEIDAVKELAP